MIIGIVLLVLFVVIMIIKPNCPDCGGKMDDIDIHHGKAVYKCRKCGKEWI